MADHLDLVQQQHRLYAVKLAEQDSRRRYDGEPGFCHEHVDQFEAQALPALGRGREKRDIGRRLEAIPQVRVQDERREQLRRAVGQDEVLLEQLADVSHQRATVHRIGPPVERRRLTRRLGLILRLRRPGLGLVRGGVRRAQHGEQALVVELVDQAGLGVGVPETLYCCDVLTGAPPVFVVGAVTLGVLGVQRHDVRSRATRDAVAILGQRFYAQIRLALGPAPALRSEWWRSPSWPSSLSPERRDLTVAAFLLEVYFLPGFWNADGGEFRTSSNG